MRPPPCPIVVAAVVCLCSASLAVVAWAHHPMPSPAARGGSPWALLWLLGAGVFVCTFVATFAVFAILERRQRTGSNRPQSARRS